jgi:hypothetical protein
MDVRHCVICGRREHCTWVEFHPYNPDEPRAQ